MIQYIFCRTLATIELPLAVVYNKLGISVSDIAIELKMNVAPSLEHIYASVVRLRVYSWRNGMKCMHEMV